MMMGKKAIKKLGGQVWAVSPGEIVHVGVACNGRRRSRRRGTGDGSVGVHWGGGGVIAPVQGERNADSCREGDRDSNLITQCRYGVDSYCESTNCVKEKNTMRVL